jgi:hypothetical protein
VEDKMLKIFGAACVMMLLAASVACGGGSGNYSSTSSGSSWTVNSVNGHISGSYTLVYDDNGYVTDVHYNFKPCVMSVGTDGTVASAGQGIGTLGADSAILALAGADRQFAVTSLEGGVLRLVSADPEFPSIIARPVSTFGQE